MFAEGATRLLGRGDTEIWRLWGVAPIIGTGEAESTCRRLGGRELAAAASVPYMEEGRLRRGGYSSLSGLSPQGHGTLSAALNVGVTDCRTLLWLLVGENGRGSSGCAG